MVEEAVRRVPEVNVELLRLPKTREPHMKPRRAHEEDLLLEGLSRGGGLMWEAEGWR